MKKQIIFPVLLCAVAICAFIFGKSLTNQDKEIPSVTENVPTETTTVPTVSYAEEYSPNTIKMIINGKVYYGKFNAFYPSSTSFGTAMSFSFDNSDISRVSFSLPVVFSGDEFYVSRSNNQDNIEFDLYDVRGNSKGFLQTAKTYLGFTSFQNPSLLNNNGYSNNGLTNYSKEENDRFYDYDDYFQIKIISKSSQNGYVEIKFKFDARFEAGQTVISGTGWMKKKITGNLLID